MRREYGNLEKYIWKCKVNDSLPNTQCHVKK